MISLSAEELRALQQQRLLRTVQQCCRRGPALSTGVYSAGVDPLSIRSLDDLVRVPLIGKQELQQAYPLEMLAVPREQVLRFHASSGTTGKQVLMPYTRADLDVWTEAMMRVLTWFGVSYRDVVLNAYGYGLFTGGLGFHYGAEALGSGGHSGFQQQHRTADHVDAGFRRQRRLLHAEFLPAYCRPGRGDGRGLCTACPCGSAFSEPNRGRKRCEPGSRRPAGIEAFDIYGLAEIIGPGVAAECSAHQGLHVLEDHFFPEIIDPVSGRRLPEGEEGELVLTTLTREAESHAAVPHRRHYDPPLRRMLLRAYAATNSPHFAPQRRRLHRARRQRLSGPDRSGSAGR